MSPGVPRWRAGPGQTACLTCGERIVVAPSSVRAYRDHAGIITLVAYCAGLPPRPGSISCVAPRPASDL
jgi:hypothetical protein